MTEYYSDFCDSAGKIIDRSKDFIDNQFYGKYISKCNVKVINDYIFQNNNVQKFKPSFFKTVYLDKVKISRAVEIMIKDAKNEY